ncbi:hypothetical protein lerEdw1_005783 [Lerista edwardsae]|nr:hypothetical protein lerEdw1_005783 [Lerista edwardsae]
MLGKKRTKIQPKSENTNGQSDSCFRMLPSPHKLAHVEAINLIHSTDGTLMLRFCADFSRPSLRLSVAFGLAGRQCGESAKRVVIAVNTLETLLQRSVVASGEQQQKAEYRISKSAWLKDTADPVIVALNCRIAALTGLSTQPPYAEYLQVVNYGLGGHYEPHFDHATLSSVEAGGSTAFIYANLSMPAVKNAALFWWNLHKNGEGDEDTLHAGCPVLAGDKWGEETDRGGQPV